MDGAEDVVVVCGGMYMAKGPLAIYRIHMETRAQYNHGSTCRRKLTIIINNS